MISYDLTELSARADLEAPFPLRHDCICTFTDMESLELLSDPSVPRRSQVFREKAAELPKPFQLVIHFVSNAPIEHPSLFEADGQPFAAVVQRPNEIVIMNLTSNQLSSIKCLRINDFNAAVRRPFSVCNQFSDSSHIFSGTQDTRCTSSAKAESGIGGANTETSQA